MPVSALILSALFQGEAVTPAALAGCALVLAGIACISAPAPARPGPGPREPGRRPRPIKKAAPGEGAAHYHYIGT